MHRAERGDDYDDAALVVADAGAGRAVAVAAEAHREDVGLVPLQRVQQRPRLRVPEADGFILGAGGQELSVGLKQLNGQHAYVVQPVQRAACVIQGLSFH